MPQAGVVGDVYIDVNSWYLYSKRSTDAGADVDPWGHYIFSVPSTYQTTLKWFVPTPPSNDIGVNGDYALLWGGYPNYGLQPSIYGPKSGGVWPTPPNAVAVTLNPLYTGLDTHSI